MLAYDARAQSVHTDTFDGPLELLLYLVRREGIDIRDIQIAPITDAYLAHLKILDVLDLDIAGDFVVLAATLCFLKSRELLPRPAPLEDAPEEDDPEALREALIRRLIDYERFKQASIELAARPWLDRDTFARPVAPLPADERPIDPRVGPMGLLQIFQRLLQQHAAPPPVHEVSREHYSLKEMAHWILDQVRATPRELTDLLRALEHRGDRVVAFLATLELVRLQFLSVSQEYHLAPVVLRSRVQGEDVDLRALSGEDY
ncbi:MAG: segregation/condensation protein A [Myxococcota bacterium]